MNDVTKIENCRICRSPELFEVINLGTQALTGFSKSENDDIVSGPLGYLVPTM